MPPPSLRPDPDVPANAGTSYVLVVGATTSYDVLGYRRRIGDSNP